MAKRNDVGPIGPNAPVLDPENKGAQAETLDPDDAAAQEATREAQRRENEALDAAVSMAQADAQREVPRLRTDSINPAMARQLPGDEQRGMLSSRMQKSYSKNKRSWELGLPKTRRRALDNTMRDPGTLEGINRELREVQGGRSQLSPNVRRRVEAVDRAISDFERNNPREHIIYAPLRSPEGMTQSEVMGALTAHQDSPMTFDGYVPATHSLGNVGDSQDVVMEIRTKSGAYLGTSDSTPDSSHIMGRGRTVRFVGARDVAYVRPDQSIGHRTIAQFEDITDDGRTTATS